MNKRAGNKSEKRNCERGMVSERRRKTSSNRYRHSTCAGCGGLIMNSVREGRRRRRRPDVSHTLHMWLWLTFHLPAWPPASHPSLASHLPVSVSAAFLDTASVARKRPPASPSPDNLQLAASARPSPAKSSRHVYFSSPLGEKKSGTDRVLPQAPDGNDASAHKRDPILMIETALF